MYTISLKNIRHILKEMFIILLHPDLSIVCGFLIFKNDEDTKLDIFVLLPIYISIDIGVTHASPTAA